MKKLSFIVILIAVVAGTIYFLTNAPDEPVAPETSGSGEDVVIYTGSGFEPQELTVPAGTTVIFQNQSSRAFWPASDPHPIHTTYQEFDARSPYAAGEEYSFTFTEPGIWHYHDHLNPNTRGTINVQ